MNKWTEEDIRSHSDGVAGNSAGDECEISAHNVITPPRKHVLLLYAGQVGFLLIAKHNPVPPSALRTCENRILNKMDILLLLRFKTPMNKTYKFTQCLLENLENWEQHKTLLSVGKNIRVHVFLPVCGVGLYVVAGKENCTDIYSLASSLKSSALYGLTQTPYQQLDAVLNLCSVTRLHMYH